MTFRKQLYSPVALRNPAPPAEAPLEEVLVCTLLLLYISSCCCCRAAAFCWLSKLSYIWHDTLFSEVVYQQVLAENEQILEDALTSIFLPARQTRILIQTMRRTWIPR